MAKLIIELEFENIEKEKLRQKAGTIAGTMGRIFKTLGMKVKNIKSKVI